MSGRRRYSVALQPGELDQFVQEIDVEPDEGLAEVSPPALQLALPSPSNPPLPPPPTRSRRRPQATAAQTCSRGMALRRHSRWSARTESGREMRCA